MAINFGAYEFWIRRSDWGEIAKDIVKKIKEKDGELKGKESEKNE